MNHLNLRRLDAPNATQPTCGHFCTDEEQFICATIELPWRNNEPQKSCIPPTIVGTRRVRPAYTVKYTFSPHFQKKTYELFGVEGRSSIRIHGANYISQLLGCIAPGMTFADINHDGVIDVARSGDALAKLISVVGTNDFTLDVIEPDPQAVAA